MRKLHAGCPTPLGIDDRIPFKPLRSLLAGLFLLLAVGRSAIASLAVADNPLVRAAKLNEATVAVSVTINLAAILEFSTSVGIRNIEVPSNYKFPHPDDKGNLQAHRGYARAGLPAWCTLRATGGRLPNDGVMLRPIPCRVPVRN